MSDESVEWTEGVCGDGAAILRDGQMVSISEILAILNKCESARASAFEEAAKIADSYGVKDGDIVEIGRSPYEAADKISRRIAAAIREHARK